VPPSKGALPRATWLFLLVAANLGCESTPPKGSVPPSDGGSTDEPRLEPLLAFTSRTVELKPVFGEKASDEVRLIGRLATTAHLKVESIQPPGPEVVVLPAEAEKPQGVRVTISGTRVGTVAGQVSIATGVENPKTLTLLYSSHVVGNLTVVPTNPFIDFHAPGPIGVVMHVTSRRGDFGLTDARIVEGTFEASFARDDAGEGYAVTIHVRIDQIPEEQRGLLGKLRLVSNDPAEPQKDVPIFALGAVNRAP
jgi:hypothetical protein